MFTVEVGLSPSLHIIPCQYFPPSFFCSCMRRACSHSSRTSLTLLLVDAPPPHSLLIVLRSLLCSASHSLCFLMLLPCAPSVMAPHLVSLCNSRACSRSTSHSLHSPLGQWSSLVLLQLYCEAALHSPHALFFIHSSPASSNTPGDTCM